MVKIREADLCDAGAISNLNAAQMGYDLSANETYERLLDILKLKNDKVFVAEIDGKVVGYVHANDYDLLYYPHMKILWALP